MKIAEFMGRQIAPFRLTKEAVDSEQLNSVLSKGKCLITSAQSLCQISDQEGRGLVGLLGLIRSLGGSVFVYGFEPTKRHGLLLQVLTSGRIFGVEQLPSGNTQFRVDSHSRNICRQFTGLSFDASGPDRKFCFVEGAGQGPYSALISIGRRPFLVRAGDPDCQLLLLAGPQTADLDAIVPQGTPILQFFSSLVPLMMFVASNSPRQVWHNNAPQACFIVDDPLLKRRYGFLDYQKLLELMERGQFCTSIAFIPWNFSRSDRELAELFAAYPHRYSLCVHGCDHTGGEFGITNLRLLREKAQRALERMTLHRKVSGVRFDDVMVFPQGIFSTAAMKALKSYNYLAAVNSTPYPVDAGGLTLRDLLEVAVTRFSNFPLFTRRSPEKLAELAFDLFLGKPALLVEHHGFFREGYEALAGSVAKLNALDDRLQWANLATTCSRACLKKVADNGDVHVLFFTDRFCLQNETGQPQRYVLVRRGSPEAASRTVTINGHRVDICQQADGVRAQVSLGAGQAVEVRVENGQLESMIVPGRQGRMYQTKVFIRRSLSEFRDNYLDKSRFLSKSARNLFARKGRRLPESS